MDFKFLLSTIRKCIQIINSIYSAIITVLIIFMKIYSNSWKYLWNYAQIVNGIYENLLKLLIIFSLIKLKVLEENQEFDQNSIQNMKHLELLTGLSTYWWRCLSLTKNSSSPICSSRPVFFHNLESVRFGSRIFCAPIFVIALLTITASLSRALWPRGRSVYIPGRDWRIIPISIISWNWLFNVMNGFQWVKTISELLLLPMLQFDEYHENEWF